MTSRLKKWIEDNPAAILTSVVVTAVAISSGVTEYLGKRVEEADMSKERIAFIEEKTQLENGYNTKISDLNSEKTSFLEEKANLESKISRTVDEDSAEKSKLVQQYDNEIEDLSQRLNSIKRGIGEQKSYLDIHILQLPSVEIRTLSPEYKSYDSNSFFVNEPKFGGWAYQLTTEGGAAKVGPLGHFVDKLEQDLGDQAKGIMGSPAHVWTGQPVADISFQMMGQDISSTIQPNIMLMRLTPEIFAQKVKAMGQAFNASDDIKKKDTKTVEEAVKAIEAIKENQSKDDVKDAAGGHSTTDSVESIPAEAKVKKIDDLNNEFDKLYAGDTTGLMFIDTLTSMFLQSLATSSTLKIYSAQKQANVMYIDADMVMHKAKIEKSYGSDCTVGDMTEVHFNRELFFISYANDGYLIRTEVPTCEGRNEAFSWITQWLAGLRITILNPS
jgi:hypothetical protein